jgi:hypothetical protein
MNVYIVFSLSVIFANLKILVLFNVFFSETQKNVIMYRYLSFRFLFVSVAMLQTLSTYYILDYIVLVCF